MSKILDALYGEVSHAFGKGLLMAGVLPAVLFLAGWGAFTRGLDQVRLEIVDALELGRATPGEAAWSLLILLALGLLFFALRGLSLRFFQVLPLGPIRSWRIREKRRARRRAERRQERLAWLVTLLGWPERGFEPPRDVPEWLRPPDAPSAVERSRAARSSLEGLAGRVPYPVTREEDWEKVHRTLTSLILREVERVADGLGALWSLPSALREDPEVKKELYRWRRLVTESTPQLVLGAMASVAYTEWTDAYRKQAGFPEEERWIQPTELGNRIAALDDYADRRYGIDTGILWTRLWGVLPEGERKEVAGAQLALETYANVAMALGVLFLLVLGSAGGDALARAAAGSFQVEWRAVGFLAVLPLLAWAAYRAAVEAFSSLAEHVRRLIDLRRLDLLSALGLERPATVAEEMELFRELRKFFTQGAQRRGDRRLRPDTGQPGRQGDGS